MPDSLESLSAEFRRSERSTRAEAKRVVKRGAQNIKNDWKRLFKGSEQERTARRYSASISYDEMAMGRDHYSAEIGPDKDRTQGSLGNLIEFGSVNNAPQNEGGRSLRIEEPKFRAQIERLGGL